MESIKKSFENRVILSIEDASLYADYSRRQFHRIYVESGGKVFSIGGKFFMLKKDVDEWLCKRKEASQETT